MVPPDFHFLRPQWLWALAPVALVLWGLWRTEGEAGVWRRVVDAHLLPHLLQQGSGSGARVPLFLAGAGWLALVLALAGPTWSRLPQPVYQPQLYRVLALDISSTMNATDVAPSRLAQARFEVLDLLKAGSEGQTALIAFGSEPYVVSPLTGDTDTIALQVPNLGSELLPVQGKRAGPALRRALDLLSQSGAARGEVILVSDGLADPGDATDAARALAKAGHRLSVLAVGTEQGAPVPAPEGGFVEDPSGAILVPRLQEEALRALAGSGGGRYVRSRPDDRDLEILSPVTGGPVEQERGDGPAETDLWREEGPWLLLALLPLAALAFRRGWLSPLLLAVCVTPPEPAYALDWKGLWSTPDQQGVRAMAADDPGAAAELFQDPAWRAAARYRAGDYAKALEELEALDAAGSDYNRGNTLARLGRLEDAIEAYDRVLGREPGHEDARHNRDLLRQLLEQSRDARKSPSDGGQGDDGDASQDGGGEDPQPGAGQDPQSGAGEDPQQGGGEPGEPTGPDPSQPSPADGDARAGGDEDPAADPQGDGGRENPQRQPTSTGQDRDAPGQADADAGEDRQSARPGEKGEEPGRADLTGEGDRETGGDTTGRQARNDVGDRGPIPESAQAVEQWLRRVPDDPAGLLRQRFLLQHLRNTGQMPR